MTPDAVEASTAQSDSGGQEQLHLAVLGPVGLAQGGLPIELGGAKTKSLLVRLVIAHNQLVPVAALLDSLWPDNTTERTEVTLRSLVSRLRQRLRAAGVPPGLVVTRPNGYMLSVHPTQIDAVRFETLTAEGKARLAGGDPAGAAQALEDALGLWRGPALGEVRNEPFAQLEADRLEELRIGATESHVDALLALGRHGELVDLLDTLTSAHWTRERLWCQRMLMLHRCGRSAEAENVFAELAARLDREMGVEPGLEANRMLTAIRAGDPALDWHPGAVPVVPPPRAGHQIPLPAVAAQAIRSAFFGRAEERAQLLDALGILTEAGTRQTVFLGGEPGIGKTSLAFEVARQAATQGAIVLTARADEEFCAPYQPWAEALTHLVEHAPRDLLESFAPHVGPLVRMVPRLAESLGQAPESFAALDPEAARYVWFGAVHGMLQAAGSMAPVVLILDDLQWADVPSLHLLRHVMSNDEPSRLLLIGIYRSFGVGAIHPLAKLLGDARRRGDTHRMDLPGVGGHDVRQMLEFAIGTELRKEGLALCDSLLDETDGNPFFIGEILQHMIDTGSLQRGGGGRSTRIELRPDDLPVSVREVIGQRVARLGDAARRTLMCASVIGREFDFQLLGAVSEVGEGDLLDILDSSIDAALVVNTGPSRYAFVHALVEHAIYDMLAPTRRARLHRRVAESIERDARQENSRQAIELAHHWAETNDPDSTSKAIGYAREAGDEALRQLAPDEALRWYGKVLSLIDQGSADDERLRCQLLVGIGDAQRQIGDARYRETLLDAGRRAQRLNATDLLVASVLANSRGFASVMGVDTERVLLLEAACEAVQDTMSPERALLLSQLALELTFGGDFERRRELADRALAIARSVGDPATRCGVINNIRQAIEVPETLAQRLELTAEAFTMSREIGDPVMLCLAALNRAFTLNQAGDVSGGDEALSVARTLADQLGRPLFQWWATIYEADRSLLAGDLEEADLLASRAFDIGSAGGQPDAMLFYGSHVGVLRTMQGRTDEIVDLVGQIVEDSIALPAYALFLAMIHCDLDQPEEARRILQPFVDDGFSSLPYDLFWLPSLYVAAYVASHLDWKEAAALIFSALEPYAGQVPYLGPARWCGISFALGLLAGTMGRNEEADRYFGQALEAHERDGAKWCSAITQLGWGSHLARRGASGIGTGAGTGPEVEEARGRATDLLHQSLEAANTHGYQLVARRAQEVLAELER